MRTPSAWCAALRSPEELCSMPRWERDGRSEASARRIARLNSDAMWPFPCLDLESHIRPRRPRMFVHKRPCWKYQVEPAVNDILAYFGILASVAMTYAAA